MTPPATPIPLSAVIPTYGRAALLARTLDSLAACARPPGYAGTLVVENGPKGAAEALVAEAAGRHPGLGLRYLHAERANKSAALNAALADESLRGLLVFFDDDVRMAPGLLEAYAAAAAAHPEGGAFFGGPFSVDYEEAPPGWLLRHLPWSARGMEFSGPDAEKRPDYYLGFNWAAFAGDIRAAGGFDPNFGPGSPTGARGQETYMQKALRQCGAEAVDVPEARVWHYVPRERCSPQWVVRRLHSSGRSRGSEERRAHERRRTKRAVRSVAKLLPRAARLLHRRGTREWYHVAIPLSWSLGVLRGYLIPASPPQARRDAGRTSATSHP